MAEQPLDAAVQAGMERNIEITKTTINNKQTEILTGIEEVKQTVLENVPPVKLKTMILPPVYNEEQDTVTSYVAYSNDPNASRITNNWYVRKSTWKVSDGSTVGLTMSTEKTFTHSILGQNYINLEYRTEI